MLFEIKGKVNSNTSLIGDVTGVLPLSFVYIYIAVAVRWFIKKAGSS